jgi:DNA-binding transcriptional MerR regulator
VTTSPEPAAPVLSTAHTARVQGEGVPDEPALTVAALARRLGVAPATLRTWDRRYGVGPSGHTTGRHRRYGAEDIARLELMQRALLRGASPAEAARYALQATPQPTPQPAPQPAAQPTPQPSPQPAAQPVPVSVPPTAAARTASSRPVGGDLSCPAPVRLAPTNRTGLTVVEASTPESDQDADRVDRTRDRDGAEAGGQVGASIGIARAGPPILLDDPTTTEETVTGRAGTEDAATEGTALRETVLDEAVMGETGVAVADSVSPARSGSFDSLVAEGDYQPAPGRRAASGGRGLKLPGASRAARGLGRAVLAMDSPGAQRLLADAFDYLGVPAAWAEVVAPVSAAILARWETSGLGVETDHLLRECVLAALVRVTPVISAPRNARPVLLACVPREPASLPLYALVATLAGREIGTRMLGAALPADALAAAIRRTAPAAVVLWAQAPRHADRRLPERLPTNRIRCRLLLAGPGWRMAGPVEVDAAGPGVRVASVDDHSDPSVTLPEDLSAAADEIERVAVGI